MAGTETLGSGPSGRESGPKDRITAAGSVASVASVALLSIGPSSIAMDRIWTMLTRSSHVLISGEPPYSYAMHPRKTYAFILGGATLWCGAIVLAPAFAAWQSLPPWVSSLLYRFFDPVCHQIDGRSFHLLGFPLAVCSRCSSVYLAFLAGALLYPLIYDIDQPRCRRAHCSLRLSRQWSSTPELVFWASMRLHFSHGH